VFCLPRTKWNWEWPLRLDCLILPDYFLIFYLIYIIAILSSAPKRDFVGNVLQDKAHYKVYLHRKLYYNKKKSLKSYIIIQSVNATLVKRLAKHERNIQLLYVYLTWLHENITRHLLENLWIVCWC
jgi:riboflavin transporter FmnP